MTHRAFVYIACRDCMLNVQLAVLACNKTRGHVFVEKHVTTVLSKYTAERMNAKVDLEALSMEVKRVGSNMQMSYIRMIELVEGKTVMMALALLQREFRITEPQSRLLLALLQITTRRYLIQVPPVDEEVTVDFVEIIH